MNEEFLVRLEDGDWIDGAGRRYVLKRNCADCKHCDKSYPSHWWCELWNAGNGCCYDGNFCIDWEAEDE